MVSTSTFGVRSRVLRTDAALLRLLPYTGGAWDTATCLAYQGYRPFFTADLVPDGDTPVVRAVARGLVRAMVDLRSMRRPSRRRLQLGADPELIWHMEILVAWPATRTPPIAKTSTTDWGRVAVDTMFRVADHGIPVSTGPVNA